MAFFIYLRHSLCKPVYMKHLYLVLFLLVCTQVLETTILGKELNLSTLVKGMYILRVFESNKVATRKLIVK